jgi:CRISPR-associated protein Cas1
MTNANSIPISYLNALVYCEKRFELEFVQGFNLDNVFTRDGDFVHETLKQQEQKKVYTGTITRFSGLVLYSKRYHIHGKLDLVEQEKDALVPVEYKRAKLKKTMWDCEKIQLACQILLLRENVSKDVSYGYVYYAGSKRRLKLEWSDELEKEIKFWVQKGFAIAGKKQKACCTENRNKCFACSLNQFCLPDESVKSSPIAEVNKVLVPRVPGKALYVQEPGASICIHDGMVTVYNSREYEEVKLYPDQIHQVVVFSGVNITMPALMEFQRMGVPVFCFTQKGFLRGMWSGKNRQQHVFTRKAQMVFHIDPVRSLSVARLIVQAKISNQRTLLMRFNREKQNPDLKRTIAIMKNYIMRSADIDNYDELLGLEGDAGRRYFNCWRQLLGGSTEFFWQQRSKRPAKDRVNSLLNYYYAFLLKECVGACHVAYLDEYFGFLHKLRYARPSLALDLMEVFRSPFVDSLVLRLINNHRIRANHFVEFANQFHLNPVARKKLSYYWEEEMNRLVLHPEFDYRLSVRRLIHLEARLLAMHLSGLRQYKGYRIR